MKTIGFNGQQIYKIKTHRNIVSLSFFMVIASKADDIDNLN